MKYRVYTPLFDEDITPIVIKFVDQFNQFSRRSAEAVIGMGRTVLEAKQALVTKNDFQRFCNGIRFDNGSSALRKLEQIGKKADILDKYLDRLPSCWTTLYYLSQLNEKQLQQGFDEKRIDHTISGDQAKELVAEIRGFGSPKDSIQATQSTTASGKQAANDSPLDIGYALTVRFDKTPTPAQAVMIEQAIRDILALKLVDGQVTRSAALDDLLVADESNLPLAA